MVRPNDHGGVRIDDTIDFEGVYSPFATGISIAGLLFKSEACVSIEKVSPVYAVSSSNSSKKHTGPHYLYRTNETNVY